MNSTFYEHDGRPIQQGFRMCAAEELALLQEEWAVAKMIDDYAVMREQVRSTLLPR